MTMGYREGEEHTGDMSAPQSFFPASGGHLGQEPAWVRDQLDLPITEAQRERSEQYLQDAFAQGRLSRDDFNRRIAQVIAATNRRELNAAFEGFVRVPLATQAVGLHPAYQPLVNQDRDGIAGRWMGTLAHWSGPFTWIGGPALMYCLAKPGSYARYEAAKAFNTQIDVGIVMILMVVLGNVVGTGSFVVLWWLIAAVLSVVSGIKSQSGQQWRNPLQVVLPLRVLDESRGQYPPLAR